MTLAARLAKLEARPRAQREHWREMLAGCFTAPQYAEHRAAIIEALCSENPAYSFVGPWPERPGEQAYYHVSWWQRADMASQPGRPLVRAYPAVFVLPVPEGVPAEDWI